MYQELILMEFLKYKKLKHRFEKLEKFRQIKNFIHLSNFSNLCFKKKIKNELLQSKQQTT